MRLRVVPTSRSSSSRPVPISSSPATFEVLPEFEVADLQELKVRRPVAEVSEADVDAMVQTLREQRVNWHAVDREAAEGDRLTIDYSLNVEGEVVTEGEGKSLIVGSSGLLPELDQTVRGMAAGDMRVFPATLPGGATAGPGGATAGPGGATAGPGAPGASDDDQGDSQDGVDRIGGDDDGGGDSVAAATAEVEAELVSEDEPPPTDDSASAPSPSRQAIGKVTVQAVEESSLPGTRRRFLRSVRHPGGGGRGPGPALPCGRPRPHGGRTRQRATHSPAARSVGGTGPQPPVRLAAGDGRCRGRAGEVPSSADDQ